MIKGVIKWTIYLKGVKCYGWKKIEEKIKEGLDKIRSNSEQSEEYIKGFKDCMKLIWNVFDIEY